MSILNVDKIQPIGSGSTVTVNATDTILTNAQAGVITATRFDGIISATTDDWITHQGDSNTRMGFPATDIFAVETAGSERLRITAAGKIGIGTDNPSQLLHLAADSAHQILLKRGGASPSEVTFKNSGNYAVISNNTNGIDLQTGSTPTSSMHIDQNGKVGIGTDNPAQKLDLRDGDLILSSSNAGNAHRTSFIEFTGSYAKIISQSNLGSQGSSNYASGWKFTTRNYTGSAFETRTPFEIHAKGDVSLPDGNVVVANGHGINFSAATDIASGETVSGSTLTDYEEGTWTPSNSTVGFENSTDSLWGFYQKVGNYVTANFGCRVANNGSGHNMYIDGLPFTNVETAAGGYRFGGYIFYTTNNSLASGCSVGTNSSRIYVWGSNGTSNAMTHYDNVYIRGVVYLRVA